jgi:hypothetical protein
MESNQEQEEEKAPEEIGLETDSSSVKSTPPSAPPETPSRRESRTASFGRFFMYALFLAVIAFVAGLTVEYFVIINPQMAELQKIADTSQAKVEKMNSQITDLQNQVSTLTPLKAKNTDLSDQLTQAQMHIYLLAALHDVTAAHLALQEGDTAGAKLALKNTPQNLDNLKSLMTPDTQQVITDMQVRLAITMGILDRDPKAAMSDFTVMENNLTTMENNLFMQP